MYEYLMNFAVAFVIVFVACATCLAIGDVIGRLAEIYGSIVIFAAAATALATIAGIGFANDEKRKREAA